MSEAVSDLASQANAVPTLQSFAVPAFAVILLVALIAPYFRRIAGPALADRPFKIELYPLLLVAGAVILTMFRPGGFLPWSVIILVPLVSYGVYRTIGGASALLLFAPVIWWWFDSAVWRVGVFSVLALVAMALPRRFTKNAEPVSGRWLYASLAGAAAIAVTMGLLTGPLHSIGGGQTAWHHWGAYLSPVEALLSGGVPYRDFPVQYGIGPTFLLASVCGNNCWNAVYWTTVVANTMQFVTLCWCVLLLTERQSRGVRRLALAAMFCAVFLWTAFPALLANAVMTPSVSGIRFLPMCALVLHVLLAERATKPSDWRGHLIWLLSMGWSMETAAYASLIWWPYLALRSSRTIADRKALIVRIVQIAAVGIGATGAVITAMLLTYRGFYGTWLEAISFFAYLNHLPTALPINLIGPVWLALAGIATAIMLLFTLPPSRESRQLYVCLIAYTASGSYFLSRSHDNNILNLFPLLVLVLLTVLASLSKIEGDKTKASITGFAHVVFASMIAFLPVSQFDSWKAAFNSGSALRIGNQGLLDRMAMKPGAPVQTLPADAVAAINDVRNHSDEGFVLLNDWKVMVVQDPHKAWTGANNLANTAPLPREMVEHYIRRGAKAYHRPGWIIFDWIENETDADIYRVAYDVAETRTYGRYRAYRLVPR
jgi:hypothetical protein